MTYRPGRATVLVNRAFAVLWGAASAITPIAGGITAFKEQSPETLVSVIFVEMVFVTLFLYFFRMAMSKIVLTDRELLAVNLFQTHRVPIWEIAEFQVGGGYFGIEAVMKDDERLILNAVQKSNWARWRKKRTRADEVVAALNARLLELRRA